MQTLNSAGWTLVNELARRYGFSSDAVIHLLEALQRGNGTMAQFNHPEFGGFGQWMQGGMSMIGDMFNQGLKARVDSLSAELASALYQQQLFEAPAPQHGAMANQMNVSANWWPAELGYPSTSGTQNAMRYAYFPAHARLVIEDQGRVTIYDTLNHQIGGVSQQQGNYNSLSFSSQFGTVSLSNLPIIQS